MTKVVELDGLQVVHRSGYQQNYGLANSLRLIAQLIKAGLSTSIYYTQLDGFDTHSGQLQRHTFLLRELDSSLGAFLDDLDKTGESERVLVLVFSEFGRRLGENGSGGTDHGTAAPVFLLGRPVIPGLHGPYPDLAHLDDEGDPRHAIDFRTVYAAVLDQWLGVPIVTCWARLRVGAGVAGIKKTSHGSGTPEPGAAHRSTGRSYTAGASPASAGEISHSRATGFRITRCGKRRRKSA